MQMWNMKACPTYAHNTYYASVYASVGSQVQIKFLSP